MTAEQQLERSVLEGKERDELHAIAQALSVKTNTRTKKADMIDSILRAAGVAVDDGPTASADDGGGEKARSANGGSAGRSSGPTRRRAARPRDLPDPKGKTRVDQLPSIPSGPPTMPSGPASLSSWRTGSTGWARRGVGPSTRSTAARVPAVPSPKAPLFRVEELLPRGRRPVGRWRPNRWTVRRQRTVR